MYWIRNWWVLIWPWGLEGAISLDRHGLKIGNISGKENEFL